MKHKISSSQFAMWRTVVAFMHVDGISHDDEVTFLKQSFSKLSFDDSQKRQLEADIENPQDVEIMYRGITEPKDRGQLIYFARLLCWSDGDFSEQERRIHEILQERTMSRVDLHQVMKTVDAQTEAFNQKVKLEKSNRTTVQKLIDAIIFWEDLP